MSDNDEMQIAIVAIGFSDFDDCLWDSLAQLRIPAEASALGDDVMEYISLVPYFVLAGATCKPIPVDDGGYGYKLIIRDMTIQDYTKKLVGLLVEYYRGHQQ